MTVPRSAAVVGGVDTHKDTHTAAVVDSSGKLLDTACFCACTEGYREMWVWMRSFGSVVKVGIEGTSSYGAGLTRFLRGTNTNVVEVMRPSRQTRRRVGKSDPVDAHSAARAALAGEELGAPKAQDGLVEVMRLLRVQRRSAMKARSQASNQMHAIVSTAPEEIRSELRELSVKDLVARARRFRVAQLDDPANSTKYVLRGLARRWHHVDAEIKELDRELDSLVQRVAPNLAALPGAGIGTAATLLVAAGDNPERLRNEASFASLCGVSPVDASSGRQHRHRLNRGGNRDANNALWVIALVRFRTDPRTHRYVERRTAEGLSKKEIIRCLKRYIAREVFKILQTSLTA